MCNDGIEPMLNVLRIRNVSIPFWAMVTQPLNLWSPLQPMLLPGNGEPRPNSDLNHLFLYALSATAYQPCFCNFGFNVFTAQQSDTHLRDLCQMAH